MEDIHKRAAIERYDWVYTHKEGRARVRLNGKYGVIDLDGNEVVPLRYDWVDDYQEGRAKVQRNRKWGVIDLDGNELLPCWYDGISRLSYGFIILYWVSSHDFKRLYFDLDCNLNTEPVNE
jgi:hypothetical protein